MAWFVHNDLAIKFRLLLLSARFYFPFFLGPILEKNAAVPDKKIGILNH